MEDYRSLAVKVGIFFVIGLILITWLSLKSEGPGAFSSYPVYAYFKNVENLQQGDSVILLGVEIGKVERISIVGDNEQAKVELKILDQYQIHEDATAEIRYIGIMGRRYINILPGTKGAGYIPEEGTVATAESIDIHDIIKDVRDAVESAKEMADTGNEMMQSLNENQGQIIDDISEMITESKENLKAITESFAESAPKISEIADKIQESMQQISPEGGSLGKFIYDDSVYENFKSISEDIKVIAAEVKEGKGSLGKVISDDALYEQSMETLKTVSEATQDLQQTITDNREEIEKTIAQIQEASKNIQEVSEKINSGEGTVAKLINDPELYNDLREMIKNISETFGGGEEQTVMRTFLSVMFSSAL